MLAKELDLIDLRMYVALLQDAVISYQESTFSLHNAYSSNKTYTARTSQVGKAWFEWSLTSV